MTKLDKLNQLLAAIDLPDHRRKVERSGANLEWLRKKLKHVEQPGLHELLSLSIVQLLEASD